MSERKFDVERRRERLLNPIGGYEWSLSGDFKEAQNVGGLASSARSDLEQAVQCMLVGFDEPAERLLKQATEWVQVAIDTKERPQRYFPNATESERYHTLALCNWLRFNRHDAVSLAGAVAEKDQYLNRQKRKDKIGVSLTLSLYVNAGAFERSLEIFATTPGLSPPKTLALRSEAQMAYILSRHQLGQQYSREEVQTATTKFLKSNIEKWLIDGDAERVAEWLKILYWNDSDRMASAKQTLMKCYEFLPGRSPA